MNISVVIGFLYMSLVPHVIQTFLKPQDLKKKYNAKWALVTGGSSGIGKALTEKLAAQVNPKKINLNHYNIVIGVKKLNLFSKNDLIN